MPTAMITGAARGIGRGIAERLVAEGWEVLALDVSFEEEAPGRRVICDVSDEASVAAAFEACAEELGEGLDLLVNNAGLAGPVSGPVENLSLEDWNRWIGVNLTGTFLMVREAVPFLREARGAVVNLSSTRARMAEPDTEAYCASKGGIEGLTQALAVSLGPEIRVNAVAPGWIVTGDWQALSQADHAQHPAGRAGRVEDIAETVFWLARAGFVTGQVVTVDGGMTRKMIYLD
ncbi:SDR family oxidoreductase [Sagittula sp. M10.9X]|uniref:SDR family oxidoreductase n=2 Tax=Sagittula salina TaxID=2820268 RepID=A0A940RYM9_9RHOB|nr:SDR family oxidoreductase [Sagittula salina]MBP0481053.1 SDR family oxidoreductase [Sagittula salina]